MSVATTVPEARADAPAGTVGTARVTGLLYLGLALTGLLGFLTIRPQLFDADDAASTLANLVEHEWLARTGIALELGVVLTQALVALWFYRLFRPVDAVQAGAIAAFGLVNAVAILGSAAMLASALQLALDPAGAAGAGDAQLLYVVAENLWGVGGLFFGLWLIPMGLCVLRSGWMPPMLGQILVAGGVGYVVAAFVRYLAPDAGIVADLLAVPATVGEFWMVGYLLLRGVRRP
jgi:hypothetical protein